jgi:HAE1 family hydrophobic/amphiphilic exporter-1
VAQHDHRGGGDPASVIATFGMMWALHFTLNSVTMLALVLMVGVVIDDAIVVLENIFRFVEEKKMTPDAAARGDARDRAGGAGDHALARRDLHPVSFMSSVSGRFLYQFGITAAVAVMVSLLVSFTLTPMMSSRMLRASDIAKGHAAEHGQARSRRGFYALLDRAYEWMLGWSMRHRLIMSILAIGVVALSYPIFTQVKREFVPSDVDEAEFQVQVTAPEGTSVPAMVEVTRAIDEEIRGIPACSSRSPALAADSSDK